MADYFGHVSYFGSKENYAKAIKDKEARKESLSDPAAASAFKRDNPSLFGGGSNKTITSPTPSSVSKSSSGSSSKSSTPSGASALIDALKGVGARWGTAGVDNAALNTEANALRSAFAQSGGSISEIPTNLWGSDPGRGFQTNTDTFSGAAKSGATSSPLKDALTGAGNSVGSGSPLTDALERAAGHAQYFGSPEKYAEAIMKNWGNLSDPEAAQVLIQGRPDLFGGPVKPGTQPYEEALQRAADEAQRYGSPEKYAEAIMKNWGNLSDPAAAEVLIQGRPELFDVNNVKEDIIYKPEQPQDVMALVNEIKNVFQQAPDPETAYIAMQQYNQTMDMINTIESTLLKRLEEQGRGVDPATQAALASLKETVDRQREGLKEEMSSRNLLQSGIYLKDVQERINRGELSETQQLLGKRLTDIQNQINSALTSFASARINATSQYGTEAVRAAESAAQRRQTATTNLQNALLKAIEESGRQKTEANKLSWEKEKFYAPWEKGPTPEQMLPYKYPTGSTVYTHDNPSANALLQHEEWQTEWPYKEAKYEYDLNRPYFKPESSAPSDADIKRENLADAQRSIWNKLNQGKSIQEVEAAIVANASEYTRKGLNVNDLIDYAWYSSTGATKQKPKQENDYSALLEALNR